MKQFVKLVMFAALIGQVTTSQCLGYDVDAGGGSCSISTSLSGRNGSRSLSVDCPESWVHITRTIPGGRDYCDSVEIEISVERNPHTVDRFATISVFGNAFYVSGGGYHEQYTCRGTIKIVQSAQEASLIEANEISVNQCYARMFDLIINVPANDVDWIARTGCDWALTDVESGIGNGNLVLSIADNVEPFSWACNLLIGKYMWQCKQLGQIQHSGEGVDIASDVILKFGFAPSETITVDQSLLLSTFDQSGEASVNWQPKSLGIHEIVYRSSVNCWTQNVNITRLSFFVQPAPNPPMAKDNNVSITPTTRNFGVNGGGNAVLVSGSSATWTAAVSDPWITLNTTSGNVGYPVAYTVSANTNVEQRTGYVYVSGWVHTVTQDGVGGTISPEDVTYEHQGGSGSIAVSAANKMVWQARPNVDWLSVTPTTGAGEGSVTYQVAPYNEVATRQGTLTVAGNTFTVFQYGRRMKLSTYKETRNYETHVIPITVNALDITKWNVTPNNSWISVVDGGNGQGGDLVSIAIAENPSYKARTGTVTIGTETFTVTQEGRPTAALSFSVSPTASTASVNGANGMISVTATPDLPWTATSAANWLTVYTPTANGAGNGNVVYNVSPNPTLLQRTGSITVTPEAASGMTAKTHSVTQPAAQSALSLNGYEFEASGEPCSVEVSAGHNIRPTPLNP